MQDMLLLMMAIDTAEEKSKFEKIYSKYKDVMYYAAYGILGEQYEAVYFSYLTSFLFFQNVLLPL